jgi:hypothetical protein
VQRSGNRLRVNVQLIDAETSNHLWAERFDKPIADLFDMQDEIVSRLANTLDAQFIAAEARRAERSVHPNAMDLYFQGAAWYHKGVIPEYMTQARGFFERALALDSGSIEALVGVATVDSMSAAAAIVADDLASRVAAAEAAVIKALSLAPEHALAHAVFGFIQILMKRPVPLLNASERWGWIEIWPSRMVGSVSPRSTAGAVKRLKPIFARRCAFLLAISSSSDG